MSQDNQATRPASTAFVPFSARLTAAMRAKETAREDSLFKDIFADRLAGSEAYELLEQKFTAQDIAYLAVRTRYFDDFIVSACSDANQLVILGAGMDTRSFRLSIPINTKVYELDQPDVHAYKKSILQKYSPKCQRHIIESDLSQPWMHLLLEKGFDVDAPSVWLLEGLLMYLDPLVVDDLLSTISSLVNSESKLVLDTVNVKGLEYEPFKGHFRFGVDCPEEYLAKYGWKATVKQPGDEEASFDRFTESFPPREVPDIGRIFLITAERA